MSDEIVINQWLADDLGAKVGDSVDLSYYVIGPERKLHEDRSRFKIVKIVPLDDPLCDPTLMPEFPGLADVNNCRDWKPGIPVDLDKIRPKDEQYWDEHRGTPKAFISLEAGQQRWRNQYGSLTAVRYPWREGLAQQIERHLMSTIDPATVGLFFQPVRERGVRGQSRGDRFRRTLPRPEHVPDRCGGHSDGPALRLRRRKPQSAGRDADGGRLARASRSDGCFWPKAGSSRCSARSSA